MNDSAAVLIRAVLLVAWDPVGTFGWRGTVEEYDRYVPHIYNLLSSLASDEEIDAHLKYIERHEMTIGSPRIAERRKTAVQKLVLIRDQSFDYFHPESSE